MLEQKDLLAIKEIMAEETRKIIAEEVPKVIAEEVPKIIAEEVPKIIAKEVPKIVAFESRKVVEHAIRESEEILLDEIERYHNVAMKEINFLKREFNEIKQYYRVSKVDNDTILFLVQEMKNLDRRVTVLERNRA